MFLRISKLKKHLALRKVLFIIGYHYMVYFQVLWADFNPTFPPIISFIKIFVAENVAKSPVG
jgi:hypothetical protein